jgi:hypothetical protein
MSSRASCVVNAIAVLGLMHTGCQKHNPEFCCLTTEDCASQGVDDGPRECAAGLTCSDHVCVVPTCTTSADCPVEMPVCTDGLCYPCDAEHACPSTAPVCKLDTGGCVGCVTDADCGTTTPVCDSMTSTCRGCKLDAECASGACSDDGACVPEDSSVFIDPAGTDAGSCTKAAPCKKFVFALTRTGASRSHIVMGAGGYVETVVIDTTNTTAAALVIHEGAATLSAPPASDSPTMSIGIATTIRDLTVVNGAGNGIALGGTDTVQLEHVTCNAFTNGIVAGTAVVAHDISVQGQLAGIDLPAGTHLTLDRGVISGGVNGIKASAFGPVVDLSNLVVYGTTDLALDLTRASGTISFVTIADSGADMGSGPRAVSCSNGMSMRSSIVWAPGLTARSAIAGCNMSSVIAGPTPVPGAMNTDPLFMSSANHDYHLGPLSPARDAVDMGPVFDFEGDPRPFGSRFDIGADEAR